MPGRFRRSMMMTAAAAAVAVLCLMTARPIAGQARASRTPDGKPSLNGIWQAVGTAYWDIQGHAARGGPLFQLGAVGAIPPGQSVVDGGEIPYQPWAAAKKKEHLENWLTLDPEIKCYLPGVPRATYLPFPFQIIQGTDKIMIVYQYASASRVIHLDKVPDSPADAWMGHSVGHWEGETLVVDVTSFNDQTWFDRAGNFHSDALHVTERYTPVSPYHLDYEVTIEDSKVFTRPWKLRMPLYRRMEKNIQLLEFRCVEFSEEVLYGDLRKKPNR